MFTRWILKAGDLVEIAMVELIENRLECLFDRRVVHHPAVLRVHRSFDDDLDKVRMTVEAPALVIFWQIRQQMCRLDLKLLNQRCTHFGRNYRILLS